MSKILLINPSYQPSYGQSKASIVNPFFPTLGLATIAAVARQRGHQVEIMDLCSKKYDYRMIQNKLLAYKPDVLGITATTPFMNQLRDISVLAKSVSSDILTVGGGAHPSALPIETLKESMLDVVCFGEADYTFADLCETADIGEVPGIYYRSDEKIVATVERPLIENLDDLPLPAWDLYDIEAYKKTSYLIAKYPPVTSAEFSRGCVFKCDFCASKITMALGYRKKSPERCAEEVKRMHSLGFREFWLTDDIFTSDQDWATEVSDSIAKLEVDMAWTCSNGIRVESANDKLFSSMKKAGCYRVTFGFESGNDEVLKKFGKGGRATIEQGRTAIEKANKSGMDTFASFLLGLSCDTEKTMNDTIEFARSLPFHYGKFGIAIAFPGTPMFSDYAKKGLIKSYDWDEYFVYTDKQLFIHEHLSYETIHSYMDVSYRKVISLNPRFIFRRLFSGIKAIFTSSFKRELFLDLIMGLKFLTNPSMCTKGEVDYFAKDKWPQHDFKTLPLQEASYQTVGKTEKNLSDFELVSSS
jgi:anaerobic magnesium-protoporphyrin IX monomethyl ester cyclase